MPTPRSPKMCLSALPETSQKSRMRDHTAPVLLCDTLIAVCNLHEAYSALAMPVPGRLGLGPPRLLHHERKTGCDSGQRAYATTPVNRSSRVILLGALGLHGRVVVVTVAGFTD